jgi:hypothetical protein
MTNPKKPQITKGADALVRHSLSREELSSSALDGNACVNDDQESGPTERWTLTDLDARHPTLEKRKAKRFEVFSPATIRWLGDDGVIREAVGTVRDISTCGLFVEATVSLRRNNNVELEIVPFGLSPGTELHFEGKIVRNQHSPRPGFAVAGFLWLAKLELSVH